MRVQLDVGSSREKRRCWWRCWRRSPLIVFAIIFLTLKRLFLFIFFLSVVFPLFPAVNTREIRSWSLPPSPFPPNLPASYSEWNAFLHRRHMHNEMAVFQLPTMSSSRHQDFIAKLHQVAWVASAGRSVVKSSGGCIRCGFVRNLASDASGRGQRARRSGKEGVSAFSPTSRTDATMAAHQHNYSSPRLAVRASPTRAKYYIQMREARRRQYAKQNW